MNRFGSIDSQTDLVILERLHRIELRIEKIGTHEVIPAHGHASPNKAGISLDVNENGTGRREAQSIPVTALQGAASYNHSIRIGPADGIDDTIEPRPPIGVRQGNATRHHLDVLHRMELIGVDERDSQALCESAANSRLAGAADTHDNYWSSHDRLTGHAS